MANSYNKAIDVLNKDRARSQAPGRSAFVATAAAAELPFYGKLRIYNSNGTPATVTVVPVESQDDAATITLTVPPNSVVYEQIVVRQVTAIGSGVTVHVFA